MSMPSWTSPRASAMTLPISLVMARASRSLCSASSAAKRYMISPRRGAGVRRQAGKASRAAATAPATSLESEAAKRAMSDPFEGSRDSKVRPLWAGCQVPPIWLPYVITVSFSLIGLSCPNRRALSPRGGSLDHSPTGQDSTSSSSIGTSPGSPVARRPPMAAAAAATRRSAWDEVTGLVKSYRGALATAQDVDQDGRIEKDG